MFISSRVFLLTHLFMGSTATSGVGSLGIGANGTGPLEVRYLFSRFSTATTSLPASKPQLGHLKSLGAEPLKSLSPITIIKTMIINLNPGH